MRRLVAAYAGTRRIVCADSYISSVETAEILLEMDLKFIGFVKNATRKYRKDSLSEVELSERGQCASVVRKDYNGSPLMMAVMWMDRDRRYFISTTSRTWKRKPCNRLRWCQLDGGPARIELSVPRPESARFTIPHVHKVTFITVTVTKA